MAFSVSGAAGARSISLSACVGLIADEDGSLSFDRLYDHFIPRLKSYLARMGSASGDLEDVAQETMLRVWRKSCQFDETRSTATTWVYAIARNLQLDEHRRALLASTIRPEEAPAPQVTPEQDLCDVQDTRRVMAALALLPPALGEVVRLTFFEDLSNGQVARRLDLPLGTVKSRLRRAAALMRSQLS